MLLIYKEGYSEVGGGGERGKEMGMWGYGGLEGGGFGDENTVVYFQVSEGPVFAFHLI